MQVEDTRLRKPALHRLAPFAGVDAGALGQCQSFGDGGQRDRDDRLIGRLRHLTGADIADMGDVASEHFEHWPQPLQRLCRAPGHDRQRSLFGAHLATRDRSVDVNAAGGGDFAGPRTGLAHLGGPHVDNEFARRQAGDDAVGAVQNLVHRGGIAHHRDDDIGRHGYFSRVRRGVQAFAGQRVDRTRAAAANRDFRAGLVQIARHRLAHMAEADEADFPPLHAGHDRPLPRRESLVCCIARRRAALDGCGIEAVDVERMTHNLE